MKLVKGLSPGERESEHAIISAKSVPLHYCWELNCGPTGPQRQKPPVDPGLVRGHPRVTSH